VTSPNGLRRRAEAGQDRPRGADGRLHGAAPQLIGDEGEGSARCGACPVAAQLPAIGVEEEAQKQKGVVSGETREPAIAAPPPAASSSRSRSLLLLARWLHPATH
jgi:hypothetical protein